MNVALPFEEESMSRCEMQSVANLRLSSHRVDCRFRARPLEPSRVWVHGSRSSLPPFNVGLCGIRIRMDATPSNLCIARLSYALSRVQSFDHRASFRELFLCCRDNAGASPEPPSELFSTLRRVHHKVATYTRFPHLAEQRPRPFPQASLSLALDAFLHLMPTHLISCGNAPGF